MGNRPDTPPVSDDSGAETNPAKSPSTADLLGRVETELAFQGDGLRELNDALATQQLELIELRTQVQHLASQMKALRQEGAAPMDGESDVKGGGHEPPPHY